MEDIVAGLFCWWLFLWFIGAIACAFLGFWVGAPRKAGLAGTLLGFFLGPFGVVAACLIDERDPCLICGERVNTGATLCPSCLSRLQWSGRRLIGARETVTAERAIK